MRVNFSPGNRVETLFFALAPGLYEAEVPIDMEVLDINVNKKDEKLIIYWVSRSEQQRMQEKTFLVVRSGEKLPRNKFAQYFWYVGTAQGLHVFEVI